MKLIVKTLLVTLITSDLANAALRGSVYTSIESSSSSQCIPEERPQVHAGDSPHSNRERFRLVQRDAICLGTNHRPYEVGVFTNVVDSTRCANMCIKDAGWDLQPLLRGINMMCDTNECQCLYDQGTLDIQSARVFDWSNYQNRIEMGVGAVDSLVSSRQYANCFSLTSNSNFFESMYELIQQSDTEGSSSSSDDSDSSSSSSEDYISDSETSSEDSPYHGSSSGSSSSSGDVVIGETTHSPLHFSEQRGPSHFLLIFFVKQSSRERCNTYNNDDLSGSS